MQIGHRKDCFKSGRCEHKPLEEQGRANEGLTLKKSTLKFFGGCLICSTITIYVFGQHNQNGSVKTFPVIVLCKE